MEMEEDTTETVLQRLHALTENGKELFCCGELKIADECEISIKLFEELFDIAENYASNRNIALQRMLPCINRNFNLDINVQNTVKKLRKVQAKLAKLPDVASGIALNEILIKPNTEWFVLSQSFKLDELESGKIIELDDSVTLTNGMFHDLCFTSQEQEI